MAAQPGAPVSEAQLRELYVRADVLRQQLSAMEAQRELLTDVTAEATRALATLEGIAGAKEGDEVLVPVGAGAFVAARLPGASTAITSIGSGVHAELPLAEAQARLRERVEGLQATTQRVSAEINRLVEEMTAINAALESQAA